MTLAENPSMIICTSTNSKVLPCPDLIQSIALLIFFSSFVMSAFQHTPALCPIQDNGFFGVSGKIVIVPSSHSPILTSYYYSLSFK